MLSQLLPDNDEFLTLGGRIRCRQCRAKAKHSGQRCLKPAMKSKNVCRTHGGASTGPRTAEGRARCALARTTHGQDSRKMRAERRVTLADLQEIEALAFALGMMTGAKKTRGPKVKRSNPDLI
jgi:hypothetical protein